MREISPGGTTEKAQRERERGGRGLGKGGVGERREERVEQRARRGAKVREREK